jgi:hypothetical protein
MNNYIEKNTTYVNKDLSNNETCDNNQNINKLTILCYSSFIFITNVITAFIKKYFLYSFLFCFLIMTSVIFHSNNNIYTFVIDKIAVISIVLYGSYILYKKISSKNRSTIFLIITTFLLTIFLYYYGYCTNNYCYNPDKFIGDIYHTLLHIISSIGHHFIIFL